MDRQVKAYIYGITTVAIWSTVASAFKLSLRYMTPVELLFYSVLFSCFILLCIIILKGKLNLLFSSDRAVWRSGLLFGFLNPFLYYLVLFKCYDLLPAQQAQTINITWGITLAILAVPFLGHRLFKNDLIAIIISYFGVYVISTQGNLFSFSFTSTIGVGLALFSTVIWSFYWIFNTRDKRDPVLGLFVNFLCSIPMIGLYLMIMEDFRIIPLSGILGAMYVGCFEMGISFVFWLLAMKHTRSTARISNLIFMAPFLSLIFIHFLVGEKIMNSSIIGLIFIVFGLVIQSTGRKNKKA